MAISKAEICACEMVDSLLEPEYKISRHLKLLKSVGIIHSVRDGKWVYHSLVQSENFQKLLFESLLSFPDTDRTFKQDFERFKKRCKLRKDGRCITGALYNEVAKEAAR